MMHGGSAGGGCSFVFQPQLRSAALKTMPQVLQNVKRSFENQMTFVCDPCIYSWRLNTAGTTAKLI
jgi:hypothetical protein